METEQGACATCSSSKAIKAEPKHDHQARRRPVKKEAADAQDPKRIKLERQELKRELNYDDEFPSVTKKPASAMRKKPSVAVAKLRKLAVLEGKTRQEHEELFTELGEALKPYSEDNAMYPDGNSLFRAVSWLASEEQDNHVPFREGAVNSIEIHQQEFNEFLEGDGAVWEHLMRQSCHFGDHLAVVGLAENMGMPVLVC